MSATLEERIALLPPEKREQAEAILAARRQLVEQNPLETFHACERFCGSPDCPRPTERNPSGGRTRQHEFMAADNKIVAAFAGNRFGKTTANVVWAIIQHTPSERLPERLRAFKRAKSRVVSGRYLTKNQKTFETVVIPELRKWIPEFLLKGGRWDKAYSKQHMILYFDNGGRLEFYTYDSDPASMVGASLDYVIYDEPPPEAHFKENWIRTTDREGVHRLGLTPVNMQGADIGFIADLFDAAEGNQPHITVCRGTIHDNPALSEEEVEITLAQYPSDERQARETGELIMFGGLVYGSFEQILREPPSPEEVRRMDVVVGIDPGLKNAAFVWVGFDSDNKALVFDELLLKESTPKDYIAGINWVNSKWGIKAPQYVIDPSARNRPTSGVGESVESLLMSHGIFASHGQNDVQAGCQQIRDRKATKGIFVVEDCTGLRGEAKKYRMEEGEEFKVVKENDHRLDALRYAVMERLWYRDIPDEKTGRAGYRHGYEGPFDPFAGSRPEYGPMGAFS